MSHLFFSEQHQMFRNTLIKFLKKEAYPFREKWEEQGIIPRDFWQKLGEQGFMCSWLDEKYGGLGTDFLYSKILTEELIKVCGSTIGISLHADIAVPYIAEYGTECQKNRWLEKCASGEIISALAMTEPEAGSDLQNIKTTAIKEGCMYRVNGQKTFITNGIHCDIVILACKTNPQTVPHYKGISLLVVEKDTPGFTKGKKLKKIGLNSQDTAELIFEDCYVPCANLLGEEGQGFYYLMTQLQRERLILSIATLSETQQVLNETLEYCKNRKVFDKPISSFQYNQFILAEMFTEIEIGERFLESVIIDLLEGKDLVTEVTMAKWWITDMANRVVNKCLQLYGGYGYMEEYSIARHFRDLRIATIYAGTNEIMKKTIANKMGLDISKTKGH